MDEASATRVTAAPDESAPERGDKQDERMARDYQITMRVSSTRSPRYLMGLLLEVLTKRGECVDSMRIRGHVPVLVTYDRNGGVSADG